MKKFVGITIVLLALSWGVFLFFNSKKKEEKRKETVAEKTNLGGFSEAEYIDKMRDLWKAHFITSQTLQLNNGERQEWYDAIVEENELQGNEEDIDSSINRQVLNAYQKAKRPYGTEWGKSWLFSTSKNYFKVDPYNTFVVEANKKV